MNIPRMRLGGAIEHRDATLLLTLSAFLITIRAPMSFMFLAAGPALVIVIQGLRRHTGLRARQLRRMVAAMVVCSVASSLLMHQADLVSLRSSLTTGIVVLLVTAACLNTGRPRQALDRLFDGIYLGLLFHWLLSLGEAVTGIKMLTILYPGANTSSAVTKHRFYVTSMYPNYNDYSVAMALLVALVTARILFRARVGMLQQVLRLVVVAYAGFEIAYMGSRGALLALILMVGLLVLHSIRVLHPTAIGVRSITLGTVLVVTAALGLFLSPWVQDHSTAQRGTIAGNILKMMAHSPLEALLGWASFPNYQAAAAKAYGSILMDPHNLLLEIIVWFGIPSLLFWLACWWVALRRGYVAREVPTDSRAVAAVVVLIAYPVLGVVCSSTLRYYLVWLFTVVAMGRLALPAWERRRAALTGAVDAPLEPVAH